MTTRVRRWPAVAAALLAAGCGDSAPPAAAWQEPASYTYVLDSACGERALIGRFRITVQDGRVAAAEGLDEPAQRMLATARSETAPTLRQLLDELDRARQAGADVAEVVTDPADGHPTKITIDPSDNSIDDESCYTITEFTT